MTISKHEIANVIDRAASEIQRRGASTGRLTDLPGIMPDPESDFQDCRVCALGALSAAFYGHPMLGYALTNESEHQRVFIDTFRPGTTDAELADYTRVVTTAAQKLYPGTDVWDAASAIYRYNDNVVKGDTAMIVSIFRTIAREVREEANADALRQAEKLEREAKAKATLLRQAVKLEKAAELLSETGLVRGSLEVSRPIDGAPCYCSVGALAKVHYGTAQAGYVITNNNPFSDHGLNNEQVDEYSELLAVASDVLMDAKFMEGAAPLDRIISLSDGLARNLGESAATTIMVNRFRDGAKALRERAA